MNEALEIEMSWLRCIDVHNNKDVRRAAIEIMDMKKEYGKTIQELQESIEIKVREDRKGIIEIIIAHDKRYRVFGSGNDYFLKKLLKAIEVKK